jgi:succinyl-CoA synthetase beta subunit
MDVGLPLVVRLAGTNVDEGNRILKESGVKYIEASDFHGAVEKVVAADRGEQA